MHAPRYCAARTRGVVQRQPLHGTLQVLKPSSRQREDACTQQAQRGLHRGVSCAGLRALPAWPGWAGKGKRSAGYGAAQGKGRGKGSGQAGRMRPPANTALLAGLNPGSGGTGLR